MGCNCGGGRGFSAQVTRQIATQTVSTTPTSSPPQINNNVSPGYAVATNPNRTPPTPRKTI